LKRFVDHRYFTRGILLAILINTLSMGIEYHNQVYFLFFVYNLFNVKIMQVIGDYIYSPPN